MESRYCAMWPIAESNRTMLAETKVNTELINRCEQRRTCWAVREDGELCHRLLGDYIYVVSPLKEN